MDTERRLLEVLFEALAGQKKEVAADLYPGLDPDVGAKRLDRVRSGELAIPAGLIAFVLRGPHAQRWIEAQAEVARRDPGEQLHRLVQRVDDVAGQLEAIQREVAALRRADRLGPVRARPRERVGRGAA